MVKEKKMKKTWADVVKKTYNIKPTTVVRATPVYTPVYTTAIPKVEKKQIACDLCSEELRLYHHLLSS